MFEKFRNLFSKESSNGGETSPDLIKEQIKSREDRIAEINAMRKMSGARSPQTDQYDEGIISRMQNEISELRSQLPAEPAPPRDGGEHVEKPIEGTDEQQDERKAA